MGTGSKTIRRTCSLALLILVAGHMQRIAPGMTEALPDQTQAVSIQMIDNGGFEEAVPADALGAFWLMSAGRGGSEIATELITTELARSGLHSLRITQQTHFAYQYVPALEELSDQTTISGSVYLSSRGDDAIATLTMTDSLRNEVVYMFSVRDRLPANDETHAYVYVATANGSWHDFSFDYGADYSKYFGHNPLPRLTLSLGKADTTVSPVYWDDVAASASFRLMSEEELLDAVLVEVRWSLDNLVEHAIDDIGTPTLHLVKSLDAVTGEVLNTGTSMGNGPVYNQMLSYLECRENAVYRAAVVAVADDIVANVDPNTRLPRRYDAVKDEFIEANVIPGPSIQFLLRIHELTGDAKYLNAAIDIGNAILDFAPRLGSTMRTPIEIPPGYIPNTYHSATGDPVPPESTYVLHIRWFASPGALMQLYMATGMTKFQDAAIGAALSYVDHDTVLNYWGEDYELSPFSFEPTWYSWDLIDPAFDDYFGYGIGGRDGPYAILAIYEQGGDSRLLPFLDQSMTHMGAVWEEGIYRGGYTFADDARSWQAYYNRYVADPVKYAAYKDLLIRNARNVFRASQYPTGAWIDGRFRLWNASFPNDQASGPRNLLAALTWAYLVDDRNPEWLAMITSVFETSMAEYKYDYGYIRAPELVTDGPNPGGTELRFLGELLNRLVPNLCGN